MKRFFTFLILIFLVFSLFYNNSPVQAATTTLQLSTDRIFGMDRIDTSIAVSQRGWPQADNVFLVEYNDYPDAIAATPLAVKMNAPILMTKGDELDPRVLNEIDRLGAKKAYLLGGTACLTKNIQNKLDEKHIQWDRIDGWDRYETSTKIAERLGNNSDSLIITNGDNFPDALSTASYAGIKQIPIVLTSRQMPDSVKKYYQTYKPQHIIVVGGEAVVPQNSLTANGITVEKRVFGYDRYETNAAIYDYSKDEYTSKNIYLASGENFPDAMVGTVLASINKAPLFITQKNDISPPIYSILKNEASPEATVYLLGGTSVILQTSQDIIEGKALTKLVLGGKTLVIDPGHGTPDPGAIGFSGTQEKNNTLPIAKYLAGYLKNAGARVFLTRDNDYSPIYPNYNSVYSDLQARVDVANQNNADLFISIHNNASTSSSAHGTETYYSQDNPQSSKSIALAQLVQKDLVSTIGTQSFGVKEAQFYVIHHTTMPAILVEVAFISNPTEERKLSDYYFRKKAAYGIYKGVLDYYGVN